ncbi:MAG: transcriptional repressor [Rhodobacteraceae bacterium]|nr:transcriptional repressor [Paracoccaceae bacterium]
MFDMDFQQQLNSLGMSVTPVRLAVLEALNENPHSEASRIFQAVQDKLHTASIQAVYKNLNAFVEHGLIKEFRPKGMSAIYETRVGDNHHHLVCRSCGLIEDTDCIDTAPCLTSTDPKDFKIDEAEIIFWGICPTCQNKHHSEIGET